MNCNNDIESKNFDGALPFVVGVTGHRDVKAVEGSLNLGLKGVKEAIKSCLKSWRSQLGDHTPIWMMTGLASGSDTLAVEAVEELIQEGWCSKLIKVVPVLPMAPEYYQYDFDTEDRDQFENYIEKYKDNLIEIQSMLPAERAIAAYEDTNYGNDRNSLYLSQGAFLARYSNVLLCLWDGNNERGYGGTADVVKLKLGQEVRWPIEDKYIQSCFKQPGDFECHFSGVVQHIPVSTHKKVIATPLDGHILEYLNDRKSEELYPCYVSSSVSKESRSILQLTQSKEFDTLVTQLGFYNTSSKADENNCNQPADHSGLSVSKSMFQMADFLAQHYQTIYRRLMAGFFMSSVIGLCAYEAVGSFLGMASGIVLNLVILLALLVCWAFVRMAIKFQWKLRYQIFRGVAEVMRIRGYLNLAGIAPSNRSLLLRRYKSKLPIFDHAICLVELDWWRYPNNINHEMVKSQWLESQKSFLQSRLLVKDSSLGFVEKAFKRPKLVLQRLGNISKKLFFIAVFIGFLLLLIQVSSNFFIFPFNPEGISTYIMVSIQYLMMTAAATALWVELAGYQSTVSGYEDLMELYDIALNTMVTGSQELISSTLQSLAKEAVLEHCEWSQSESKVDITSKAIG